jgi:hypothetical protein
LSKTEEPKAFQLILDENMINAFFMELTSNEKMYSLREFLSNGDPRFEMFKQFLTTSTLGMALPNFKTDYPEGTPIDIVGTLSHDFIQDTVSDVFRSGINLDKNGMLKGRVNFGA